MKKLLFLSILFLTILFFAFNKPAGNDRPNGVDQDHWVKINDEMGIVIGLGNNIKKVPLGLPGACTGKIMFRKDNKWHTLIYQSDNKVYNKFLSK